MTLEEAFSKNFNLPGRSWRRIGAANNEGGVADPRETLAENFPYEAFRDMQPSSARRSSLGRHSFERRASNAERYVAASLSPTQLLP